MRSWIRNKDERLGRLRKPKAGIYVSFECSDEASLFHPAQRPVARKSQTCEQQAMDRELWRLEHEPGLRQVHVPEANIEIPASEARGQRLPGPRSRALASDGCPSRSSGLSAYQAPEVAQGWQAFPESSWWGGLGMFGFLHSSWSGGLGMFGNLHSSWWGGLGM